MPAAPILVVDDEPDIRSLLKDVLEDEGYRVQLAANAGEARQRLAEAQPAAVLLDIWMPGEDGIALLRSWQGEGGPGCPVVMMSGHGTIETAVEATRLGAYDFIEKPITLAKLLITLERALEAERLKRDNLALRQQVQEAAAPVGESAAMRSLRQRVERLAAHETPVLLRGEAGTGKESLARWLHSLGARREGPFLAVGPGNIPSEQAAASLFGSEQDGRVQPGLLEQAAGGTLFLDEVAELSAELQLRLSSALERRSLLRIGGTRAVELDVRLLAASSQDLDALVRTGRFREELYYQLNVVPLEVPPLRQRLEDLEPLVAGFVEAFVQRDGLGPRRFGVAAFTRLRRHDWPGNVRELRNLVQRLLVLGGGETVEAEEIDAALSGRVRSEPMGEAFSIDYDLPLREARDRFERAYLTRQLEEAGGSVGKLAKLTGMERTHLYRKLRDLGIELRG
jgi:two-component system, NtrC family, nitrogen regulation response regulator NtrX